MPRISAFNIPKHLAEQIVRGVAGGEYQLLTGAGFNAHTLGGDSKPLPLGKGLSRDISADLNLDLDDSESEDLKVSFAEAKRVGADRLRTYLRNRLTNTKPKWQKTVLKLPWLRIWTLNIDDVMEQAFDAQMSGVAESIPVHMDDPYRLAHEAGKVQTVYLHGRAISARSDLANVVFTTLQYSQANQATTGWKAEFWTSWSQRPFITVGAKLDDEVDLEAALDSGSMSATLSGRPSLLIGLGLTPRQVRKWTEKGLLPIDADAREFFLALALDVQDELDSHPEINLNTSSSTDALVFLQAFSPLSQNADKQKAPHDFFSGDEPKWTDINLSRDAIFPQTEKADEWLRANSSKAPVAILTGQPGSGKSAALLRLGAQSLSNGKKAFLYSGDRGIDIDSTLAVANSNPGALFLFDNCSDIVVQIAKLARKAVNRGISLRIAAADRNSRANGIRSDLAGLDTEEFKFNRVNRDIVARVCSLRAKNARLGILEGTPPKDRFNFFLQKHEGDLFSALSDIEGARGFAHRMDIELDQHCSDASNRDLITLTAIVHRHGYSLPVSVASQCIGTPVSEIHRITSEGGPLAELISTDRNGLRLRHRMLAERYTNTAVTKDSIQDASRRIAIALAPLVTREAITRRHTPYLIVRTILDKKNILEICNGSVASSREWYESIKEHYDWNARYWDQRALLESGERNHEAAFSYAKKAVNLNGHSFSLTTLGTVLLRAAADERTKLSEDERFEAYEDGERTLRESRQQEVRDGRGGNEHPLETYFAYAGYVSKLFVSNPARLLLIETNTKWWLEEAATFSLGRADNTVISRWQGKYLNAKNSHSKDAFANERV